MTYTNGTTSICVTSSNDTLWNRSGTNTFLRNNEDNVEKEQENYRCPAKCLEVCSYRESKGKRDYCIIEALHTAKTGDVEKGIVFAGTNAYRAKEQGVVPAKQILDELTATD